MKLGKKIKKEIKHRDRTLRNYIKNRTWDEKDSYSFLPINKIALLLYLNPCF